MYAYRFIRATFLKKTSPLHYTVHGVCCHLRFGVMLCYIFLLEKCNFYLLSKGIDAL